jgi:hypothetical protein
MTITEKALADLLLKYFTTLEPVATDVTLKNEMKKVPQPDGSTKAQMVPTKGDAYLPKDVSNSMAKAIAKAIWPQLGGASPFNEPWFEWNAKDLTQFDSPVYGSNVDQVSSVVDVVDHMGLKWIRMKSVTTAGTGLSGTKTGIVLPISATPPSADYVVLVDFISTIRIGTEERVGAGVVARFQDMEHGYTLRYKYGNKDPIASGNGNQDIASFDTGSIMHQLLQLNDPSLHFGGSTYNATYIGMFMGIAVEGTVIRALVGEKGIALDDLHSAAGKAGIMQSTVSMPSDTTESYFRNLRCYKLDVLNHTVP